MKTPDQTNLSFIAVMYTLPSTKRPRINLCTRFGCSCCSAWGSLSRQQGRAGPKKRGSSSWTAFRPTSSKKSIHPTWTGLPNGAVSRRNLKSVLYNLLSNVVKYRAPDRPLRVGIACQQQADYLVLVVADNGLGMDMRQEEKMFALFKRLHNHVEGAGIGLYMVRKMLENAAGKITATSQVGVGSTFNVFFKR
jgi:signal transduction histidine kinase